MGCFWGHRWTKWQTTGTVRLTWAGVPTGIGEKQRRECTRCGKVKLRIEEADA